MVSQIVRKEALSPLNGNPRSQEGPAAESVALKNFSSCMVKYQIINHKNKKKQKDEKHKCQQDANVCLMFALCLPDVAPTFVVGLPTDFFKGSRDHQWSLWDYQYGCRGRNRYENHIKSNI